MVDDVASVDVETSLEKACRLMGERHIGSVVVARAGKPVGIFTERDLLSKVIPKGVDLGKSRMARTNVRLRLEFIPICVEHTHFIRTRRQGLYDYYDDVVRVCRRCRI